MKKTITNELGGMKDVSFSLRWYPCKGNLIQQTDAILVTDTRETEPFLKQGTMMGLLKLHGYCRQRTRKSAAEFLTDLI